MVGVAVGYRVGVGAAVGVGVGTRMDVGAGVSVGVTSATASIGVGTACPLHSPQQTGLLLFQTLVDQLSITSFCIHSVLFRLLIHLPDAPVPYRSQAIPATPLRSLGLSAVTVGSTFGTVHEPLPRQLLVIVSIGNAWR